MRHHVPQMSLLSHHYLTLCYYSSHLPLSCINSFIVLFTLLHQLTALLLTLVRLILASSCHTVSHLSSSHLEHCTMTCLSNHIPSHLMTPLLTLPTSAVSSHL